MGIPPYFLLFDRLRIIVRSDSFGLVVSLNSCNSCHSEKTENLASSVDFRLIQNLSMLIEVSLSEITLAGWVSRPTSFLNSLLTTHHSPLTNEMVFSLLTFHFSLLFRYNLQKKKTHHTAGLWSYL